MEKLIRLLTYTDADGADNMAADEALLHSAAEGTASLRFYRWSQPTVSLGYFQPAAARDEDRLLSRLPFVRRATGGATLVHHHEVTYALALPPNYIGKQSWLLRMHRIITQALLEVGVPCTLVEKEEKPPHHVLCFQHFTPGDVVCNGSKVVGSAQRKAQQCLLQHGAVLLSRSEFAPVLPGVLDLAAVSINNLVDALPPRIIEQFVAETGWDIARSEWTSGEKEQIKSLRKSRYDSPGWNRKR